MKTTIYRIFVLSLAVIIACTSYAQHDVMMRKADDHYQRYEYADALELYLHLSKKDKTDALKVKIAHCYAKMNKFEEEEAWFNRVKDKTHMKPEDHYMYAQVLLADGKIEEAHKWFELYDHEKHADSRGARKLYTLDHLKEYYKDSTKYKITNMKSLNSEFSEFGAAYYKDGLVFASSRFHEHGVKHEYSWDHSAFLDLYYSPFKGDNDFEEPYLFDNKINTKYHEGPLTFNEDQTKIIFSRNNYEHGHAQKSKTDHATKVDLFEAELEGDKWNNIHKLNFEDREYTYEHPTMDKKHKTLIFASDIPGGQGGMDLYVSKWKGTGWGKPVNLGDKINTEGNEGFPFLHESGTLYFASDGHGGIGGLDIYSIEDYKDDNAEVTDLGFPINSHRDDFGLIINEDQTMGYFSSNRKGGIGSDDIYKFQVQGEMLCGVTMDKEKKEFVGDVHIKVSDAQGELVKEIDSDSLGNFDLFLNHGETLNLFGEKEKYMPGELEVKTPLTKNEDGCIVLEVDSIEIVLMGYIIGDDVGGPLDSAEVKIQNLTTGEEFTFITKEDGYFSMYAAPETEYLVNGSKVGYLPDNKSTSTAGVTTSKTIEVDLSLHLKKIRKGVSIQIKIFYAFNSADILPEAEPHLNELVKTMNDNPEIKVELSSHTDSRGKDSYNMKLSQRRAQSAVNYIVAKGIDKNRIIAKGYGESKLLNSCGNKSKCSEEEHSVNRRSEITILDDK